MRRVSRASVRAASVLLSCALAAVATPRAIADAPPGRYTIAGATSATVTDGKTGLTWLRDVITPPLNTLESATKACPSGYRLPDIKELATLVDESASGLPYLDSKAFPKVSAVTLWSSTMSNASATDYQSFVMHPDGTTERVYYNGSGTTDLKVLCVSP